MRTSPAGTFLAKTFSLIDRERDALIWGFGFATDFVMLYQGQHENNFITYAAAAALAGNAIRCVSRGVQAVKGKEIATLFGDKVKPVAAAIHHSAGLSLICSGLNLGHTGFSVAEIAFGLCSTSGSVMQFWGNDIVERTGLRNTRLFRNTALKHADGGKIATFCYLPVVPSAFEDAWRLNSPALVGVGLLSSAVLALLFTQGKTLPPGISSAPAPL
jgi:hypothetical protein